MRFQVKWVPVRVKKTRQNVKLEPEGSNGGKLQNFVARSYSLARIVRVFHLHRRQIHRGRMADLPPKRGGTARLN
jgi:hypothetical protein